MPIPSFMPVIGSNFDAIANQQLAWQGFNRGVEEGNISRAARAQEEQNNWLAKVAELQSHDAARQDNWAMSAAEARQKSVDQAKADAESRRQFDVGAAFKEKELKSGADTLKWQFDLQAAERQRTLDATESTAKFIARDARKYVDNFNQANQELSDATREVDTAAAQQVKNYAGKITYTKNKTLVPVNPADPDAQKTAAEANVKVADAKARYDQAVENHKTHLQNLFSLKQNAQLKGLVLGDDGTVFSPLHGKPFGAPVDTTPEQLPPELDLSHTTSPLEAAPPDAPPPGLGWPFGGPAPKPDPAAIQASGQAGWPFPKTSPSAVDPFQRGRFVVVPH